MKISPSNQTLILANERPDPGLAAGTSATKTAPSAGSVLQRVTIVASQPDSVVYLRADYSSTAATPITYSGSSSTVGGTATVTNRSVDTQSTVDDTSSQSASRNSGRGTSLVRQSAGTALQSSPLQNYSGPRDGYGNVLTSSRDTGISSYLPPVEQYARTQRLSADSSASQYVDVLA